MRRKTIFILVGAALAVAVLAVILGQTFGEQVLPSPDVTESPTTEPSPESDIPEGFTRFEDADAGFAMAYPEDWERVSASDETIRLVVTPNDRDSILVRALTLDVEVGAEDLASVRSFTDDIVGVSEDGEDGEEGEEGVELLAEPAQVEVGGLPGIYYLYNFDDADTGEEGVHSHYFLFDGDTMFAVVLQALPTERFVPLAPTFDSVMNTFEPM